MGCAAPGHSRSALPEFLYVKPSEPLTQKLTKSVSVGGWQIMPLAAVALAVPAMSCLSMRT